MADFDRSIIWDFLKEIFCIHQILERKENCITMRQYISFKKAHDSSRRDLFYNSHRVLSTYKKYTG
jgi:hypothetical protein